MGNIGVWELVIIVILVIVIFGGRRLPELGRGLGQGLANFRRAVREPDQAGPAAGQRSPAEPPAAGPPEPEEASAEKRGDQG
ncbi:MAG: twin-arginine translocase TatA/TatE family subunit [Candidatus Adiutrix sp.]|jgi:sec-independent protein translocase protein TatA|nr:twin-arginine translocase TatA/TatE family subunit [Candidatus Adiutrix sp.]